MTSKVHPVGPEELMAYLDGELKTARASAVADHLQECRECQILSAEFKHIADSMTAWDVPATSTELPSELTAALEERETNQAKGGWRRWWPRFPRRAAFHWAGGAVVGAVAALLLAFSLVFSSGRSEHARPVIAEKSVTLPQVATSAVPTASGGDRDRLATQWMASLTESQRAELTKRTQQADLASNLEIHSGAPGSDSGLTNSGAGALPTPPMIVRTAQVTVVAQNLDKARSDMDEIVRNCGGYLGDLSVFAPADGPRRLTATLRIPANRLDAALAEVKKLGRVESESQNGEDVTAQYVDLEARLSNARNTEQRLLDLLRQRTGKLSDVLEVETELSRVREEIERMEGERRLLAKQVSFSTITATVTEVYKTPAGALPDSLRTRFRNAAVEGYQSVVNFFVAVALFLLSNGLLLLIWAAILYYPVRWIWRKMRAD